MQATATPTEKLDFDLLHRVAAGDQASFSELYDRFAALTYGLFSSTFPDSDLVQRAMHGFWLTVWSNAPLLSRQRGTVESVLLTLAEPFARIAA